LLVLVGRGELTVVIFSSSPFALGHAGSIVQTFAVDLVPEKDAA
jgi:hypothetical protein